MRFKRSLALMGYVTPFLVFMLLFASGNAAPAHHDSPTSLVIDYHMDEAADNTCDDGRDACDSSNGLNLTFSGTIVWTDGRFGNATDYEESDSADVAFHVDNALFSPTVNTSWTYMAWINPETVNSDFKYIISKSRSSTPTTEYEFRIANDDTGQCVIGSGSSTDNIKTTGTLSAGVWVHMTCRLDGTNLSIWTNGTLNNSKITAVQIQDFTEDFRIGNYELGSLWYDGLVDEVRLFDGALTPAEIAAERDRNGTAPTDNPPNVTIASPGNETFVGTQSIPLNYTVTDDIDATLNCTYVQDGVSTNTPAVTEGQQQNISLTWPYATFHNITVICIDSQDQNDTETVIFQNFFIQWNVSIFNEKTEALFDMTQPNETTFEVFCPTETLNFNVSSNEFLFNATCTYDFIRLKMEFGTDDYVRTLIPPTTNTTINWYMVDLNTHTLVELTLTIDDFTGDFSSSDTLVRITKTLSTGQVDIIEQFIDIEKKVILFLVQSDVYAVQVENEEAEIRVFGDLIIDSDTDKTLRISDIPLQSDITTLYDVVNYSVGTPTNSSIRLVYNDSSGGTSNVTFTIFNESNLSQILFNESVTNTNDLTITWGGANVNNSYEWRIQINHSTFGFVVQYSSVNFGITERIPLGIGAQWRTIFAVMIVLMVAASMTTVYSGMAATATVGTMSILKYWGWLPQLTLGALAFLWIIAILSMIIKGEGKL